MQTGCWSAISRCGHGESLRWELPAGFKYHQHAQATPGRQHVDSYAVTLACARAVRVRTRVLRRVLERDVASLGRHLKACTC